MIDLDHYTTAECGATLMATLAYPAAEDLKRRDAMKNSLWNAGAIQGDGRSSVRAVGFPPDAVIHKDDAAVRRDCAKMKKLFDNRIAAAEIAAPFLPTLDGSVRALPKGAKRLSLNEMIRVRSEGRGDGGPENFEARVWKPSKPVIHLCLALQKMIELYGGALLFSDLLTRRDVIANTVNLTGKFENEIRCFAGFPVSANVLISIRLASQDQIFPNL